MTTATKLLTAAALRGVPGAARELGLDPRPGRFSKSTLDLVVARLNSAASALGIEGSFHRGVGGGLSPSGELAAWVRDAKAEDQRARKKEGDRRRRAALARGRETQREDRAALADRPERPEALKRIVRESPKLAGCWLVPVERVLKLFRRHALPGGHRREAGNILRQHGYQVRHDQPSPHKVWVVRPTE